ncbi:MAG: hypothetical protein Q8N31_15370 [Reyranella sp.]|nr:hypothetical protein [Reyranella sp.]MDP3161396.1 hypothetical protein [Reyranella sp.]
MISSQHLTRTGLVLLALTLGACNTQALFKAGGYSNPRDVTKVERAYEARDACLSKNAAPTSGEPDVASVARAVSLSCMPETNQLIAVTNPYQDPKVTAAIMADNDAKALRYVRLARGEGSN